MPISISINESKCLRIVRFEGAISAQDMKALLVLYSQNRDWLGYDSFYLLDADSADLDTDQLDRLRQEAFSLYRDIDLIIVRRTAWIPKNAEMRRLAEYWITARHSRDGTSAEFCLGDNLENALGLFTPEDVESVRTGAGFREIAHIGAAAGV